MKRLPPAAIRDLLLVGLTFSSGAVDAISFLALGKVFTAFMTGNVVFLGFGVAGSHGPGLVRVAVALGAFGTGVFVATRIVGRSSRSSVWPGRVTAALGAGALGQAAFVAVWMAADGRPGRGAATLLVGVSAVAMGLQSGAVLKLGVRGVFTTATTATLMFLAGESGSAPERRRLGGVLAGLLAGAAAGGALVLHARPYAPFLPLVMTGVVISVAATVMSRREGQMPASRNVRATLFGDA